MPQGGSIVNRLAALGVGMAIAGAFLAVVPISWYLQSNVEDHHAGQVVIPPGSFFEFEFIVFGNFTEVYCSFQVQSGPPVDIYLLRPADLENYRSGLPLLERGPDFVLENVTRAVGSPYPEEGRYHAIIDNTDYGAAKPRNEAVVVSYIVDAGGVPGDSTALYGAIMGSLAFGVLAILVGIILTAIGVSSLAPELKEIFSRKTRQESRP